MESIPTLALLGDSYRWLADEVFAAVAAHVPGIRPAHGNVMEHLERGDGRRLTEIAAASGLTPQSIGELVDQLEELGYVERRPDTDDRRAKRIHLTRKGRSMRRHSLAALAHTEALIEQALGSKGHADLRRSLLRLASARPDPAP